MLFGRRIWTALALAMVVWLLPTQAFSVEEDQYAFKSALGRVYFEFERNAIDQNNNKTTSNRFLQRYSLDFRGYVLNRRLLIYDIGYNYTNNNYRSDNTHNTRSIHNYSLRTTALPLSAIPLTLWASRRTTRTATTTESTTTENKYGMRWYLYFRTLPKTTISAERDDLTANDGSSTITDTYRLDLEKAIGPTENYFSYYLVNSSVPGNETSRYAVNFNNHTKISRASKFFFGATRSEGDSTDSPAVSLTGVSLSLNSTPSKDFSQNHSYNYYENKTESTLQTGSAYSGDMRYRFSRGLHAFFTLNVDDRSSTSRTFKSDSVSLGTTMNVSYQLTNTTSISQLVAYSRIESNSNDPAATNLADTETLRTLTTLGYSRRLNWAAFRATAAVGYTDESSGSDRAGQAIAQRYTLSLSNIDLNKYVGGTASLNYSSRTTISGKNIDNSRYSLNLVMFNKEWKKYIIARASYTRSGYKTYISDFETKKEKYRLKGTSNYFKNTKLTASVSHDRVYEELIGNGRSTTLSFGANHRRKLLKGQLALSYTFTTTKSNYEGGSDTVNTTIYSLHYNKTLLKSITWRFLAQRSEQDSSNSFSNTTIVRNSLVYPLRSWLLSGDHEYRLTEYSNTKRAETLLLLKATRVFVRIW